MLATEPAVNLIEAARALGPTIRTCREQIEQERRLPPVLLDAIVEAGLFRMTLPRSVGGLEADPITVTRVVEALSFEDGAVGWSVMIANQNAAAAYLLAPDAAAEIFGDARAVCGGSSMPKGRAVRVAGGYRVTGRWPLASGIDHATWIGCSCIVVDDHAVAAGPGATPQIRRFHLPPSDCQILDTWTSTGLRGTASHDFVVDDIFVPEERTHPFPGRGAQVRGVRSFQLMGHGGHALGIARAAIDMLVELACAKTPTTSKVLLRDDRLVQHQVAQADTLVESARSHLYGTAQGTWDAAGAGAEITRPERARLRMAVSNAVTGAVQAVDMMYAAGGSSSIYASNPLDRHFRDIHTAAAHMLVNAATYVHGGRVLLGLEPENPNFLL
jgi:indole-3-acetate monooxygenase